MTEIKRYKIEDNFLDLGVKGGLFVREEDYAALQEQVRALAEFRGKVRASFHIGELAEDFAVFVNIQNAMRRSDCLSAVEREFFTREVPGEDYPDEMIEECELSWGKEPKEYTDDFRKVLSEIQAQAVNGFSEFCGDNSVFIKETCNYDSLAGAACIYLAHIREGEQP